MLSFLRCMLYTPCTTALLFPAKHAVGVHRLARNPHQPPRNAGQLANSRLPACVHVHQLPSTHIVVTQEGTQTNFFALLDGTLYTAPLSRVLGGTIRAIVTAVCRENDIPLREEAVPAATIREWQGAFICSTSRLVLPISKVYVAADGADSLAEADVDVPLSPVVDRVAMVG